MITNEKVYNMLCLQPIVKDVSQELVLSCCEYAVKYIEAQLRSDVNADEYLLLVTATAVAEHRLFTQKYSEIDTYDTYSMGDITFRRNCERELKVATEKLKLALAQAASILKDGGFYFAEC